MLFLPQRVPNPLLRGLRTEMKGLSMDKLTCWHSGSGVSSSGDVKRRRQTPPDSPSNEGQSSRFFGGFFQGVDGSF